MVRVFSSMLLSVALAGCVGTTGGDLFDFDAAAAGPEDARAGEAYTFTNGRGYEITLHRARLHVGAVYMNKAVATSVSRDTSCTLAGIYVAEVTSGVDVDLLSPEPVPFPERGYAVSEEAKTGEVWLMGGDVNQESDPTVILEVEGVARKGGAEYPFEGSITIGKNRALPPQDPALPGSNPICKQRIVTPIPIDITPRAGGRLLVRVRPQGMFANVEFSALEADAGAVGVYRFRDDGADAPSKNLYAGLRASVGVYAFQWIDD